MHSNHASLATVDMGPEEGRARSGSPIANIPEQVNENGVSEESPTNGLENSEGVVTGNNDAPLRLGTISSARFNLLCTMVGGGCLSLPMGFQKSGNALMAPILLLLTAIITEFCFQVLVSSARKLSPVRANTAVIGKDSFETLASAAFGIKGFLFTKWLVTAMCFFGAVGYAVLLRDMLQPITHSIVHHFEKDQGNTTFFEEYASEAFLQISKDEKGPSLASNLTMLTVILLITPVCTLKNLSSLEKLGAVSMSSILVLGGCVAYRSFQCNFYYPDESFDGHVWSAFKFWPDSMKDVLDAFPLYVSCYVCHYNVPAVHNELQNPTPKRVNWWLRSTTVSATMFYMLIGIAGSTYGHCIPTGKVQGNILLDFDEHDPLLLVARMCLACTLTLAFPLLVIPARDILLRSWFATSTTTTTVSVTSTTHHHHHHRHNQRHPTTNNAESSNTAPTTTEEVLREPLLANEQREENVTEEEEEVDDDSSETVTARATATAAARSVVSQPQQHSFSIRLGAAILVLWSAAALASCVKSIDIVWDLLGSSLSIFLSYLIPCGTFVVIVGRLNSGADGDMEDGSSGGDNEDEDEEDAAVAAGSSGKWKRKVALTVAWVLIGIYIPLMLISSANAIYGTFFS